MSRKRSIDTNISISPETEWIPEMLQPVIDESANIDPSAVIIGGVTIGKNVNVAPNASIRGDEGVPIYIGDDSNVQDGVVIHALMVDGTHNTVEVEDKRYAVYVGKRVSMAHLSQVHGPAAVGDDTFVGMGSIVFKATVGNNCVILPGATVMGVNIPDGMLVPAGAAVTDEAAVKALKPVKGSGFEELNEEVVHVNKGLAKGYKSL